VIIKRLHSWRRIVLGAATPSTTRRNAITILIAKEFAITHTTLFVGTLSSTFWAKCSSRCWCIRASS